MDLACRYLSSVATSGSNQLCLCSVRPHFLYYLVAMVKKSGSDSSLAAVVKGVIKKVFKSPDVAEADNVKTMAASSGWLWEAQQLGRPATGPAAKGANADDAWKREAWNLWTDAEWALWQLEKRLKKGNTKGWPDEPAVEGASASSSHQDAWAWKPQPWWNLWTQDEWTEWQRAKDSSEKGNYTYKKKWPANPYVNSDYNPADWIDYEQPESSAIGGQLPLTIRSP
jgi:hypothetical protein